MSMENGLAQSRIMTWAKIGPTTAWMAIMPLVVVLNVGINTRMYHYEEKSFISIITLIKTTLYKQTSSFVTLDNY